MARLGVHWAYFNSWTGKLGPASIDPAHLKTLYQSAFIQNRPSPTTQNAR
jgi:hypothetical protein